MMSNKLGGMQGTSYLGTNANQPPNWRFEKRDPTQYDTQGVVIGDFWINKNSRQAWVLVSLAGDYDSKGSLATWFLFTTPENESLTGNNAVVVLPDSMRNINLEGDGETITVLGDPSTHTLTMSVGGSLFIGSLEGNSGGKVFRDSDKNIDIIGDGVDISVTGNPSTHTLTISAGGTLTTSFDTDSGTATPASSTINIAGGANIGTVGSSNIVTIDADTTLSGITDLTVDNITVSGSATLGYLSEGVVQTNSSGLISSSKGTDGQTLISSSTGAPAWATLTGASGISVTNGPNSIIVSESMVGGNGWMLIGTFGGSTGGSITTGITSSYKTLALVYQIGIAPIGMVGVNIPVLLSLSSDGGITYYTTNYISGLNYRDIRGINSPVNVSSTTTLVIGNYTNVAGLYTFSSGIVYLYNMTNTDPNKMMSVTGSIWNTSANYTNTIQGSGVYKGSLTGPINALRVSLGGAAAISYPGYFSLYGLTY